MKVKCPFCPVVHNSADHDVGEYFVCCGHARLVWVMNEGRLELRPVAEDMVLNEDEE